MPAPMRILRAWLFRERAVRGPAAIELDVVDRQISREEQSVKSAARETAAIERRLDKAKDNLRRSIAGREIDLHEARKLARTIVRTSVAAHHHTTQLEALR